MNEPTTCRFCGMPELPGETHGAMRLNDDVAASIVVSCRVRRDGWESEFTSVTPTKRPVIFFSKLSDPHVW